MTVMTDGSYPALSLKKSHKEKQMVPIYNSLVVFEAGRGVQRWKLTNQKGDPTEVEDDFFFIHIWDRWDPRDPSFFM